MPISDQLKQAIRDSGMSIMDLARATGVTQPVISRFIADEGGNHRDIRMEKTADRLAEYFGLELVRREKRPAKKGK